MKKLIIFLITIVIISGCNINVVSKKDKFKNRINKLNEKSPYEIAYNFNKCCLDGDEKIYNSLVSAIFESSAQDMIDISLEMMHYKGYISISDDIKPNRYFSIVKNCRKKPKDEIDKMIVECADDADSYYREFKYWDSKSGKYSKDYSIDFLLSK